MTTEYWRPDANFYDQSERSSAIRDACIRALNILERVYKLKGRPDSYKTDLLNLYAQLEQSDGELLDLGIEDRMHLDVALNEADSDTVAEWLASQLKSWLGPEIDAVSDPEVIQMMMDFFYFHFDIIPPEGI